MRKTPVGLVTVAAGVSLVVACGCGSQADVAKGATAQLQTLEGWESAYEPGGRALVWESLIPSAEARSAGVLPAEDEPVGGPAEEEPAEEPVEDEPGAEPVEDEPAEELVEDEPEAEPAGDEPAEEVVEDEPEAEPAEDEPEAEPVEDEPAGDAEEDDWGL